MFNQFCKILNGNFKKRQVIKINFGFSNINNRKQSFTSMPVSVERKKFDAMKEQGVFFFTSDKWQDEQSFRILEEKEDGKLIIVNTGAYFDDDDILIGKASSMTLHCRYLDNKVVITANYFIRTHEWIDHYKLNIASVAFLGQKVLCSVTAINLEDKSFKESYKGILAYLNHKFDDIDYTRLSNVVRYASGSFFGTKKDWRVLMNDVKRIKKIELPAICCTDNQIKKHS